jgi:hypothetical protein
MDKIFTPLRSVKEPNEQALRQQIALDLQEIRFLARRIQTRAEFERIVSEIGDPATRAQVRDLLRPLVSFSVDEADGRLDAPAADS